MQSVKRTLAIQAESTAQLIELAGILRTRPEIKSVVRSCDVRSYRTSTMFEGCVDVETHQGDAVSFWFEFGFEDGRWHVSTSIRQAVVEGQDVVDELTEVLPETLDDLEAAASRAVTWLCQHGRNFDFRVLRDTKNAQ